jgi:uncharacterized protein
MNLSRKAIPLRNSKPEKLKISDSVDLLSSLDLSLLDIALAITIVAIGTAIQSAIGFGLAMIAAPLLVLVSRSFVPGPLIVAAFFLVIWMSYADRHALDLSNLKAALFGRLIGTPPAALLIGSLSAATYDLVFGSLVLLAVLLSLIHANIIASPRNVFLATIASGFMSTMSSIGGPPLALVYQNARGPALRANLSILFTMGCMVSLTALIIVGKFQLKDLIYSAILLLGVIPGVGLSGPIKRRIDKQTVRPVLLGLCAISALLVLGRAFILL